MPLSTLVKLSALLKYGLLAVVIGLGLVAWGLVSDNTMPERSALEKVEGRVTAAKKVTVKRRRSGESVHYELTVAGKDKGERAMKIPQSATTDWGVRAMMGQPVVFEVDGDSDVYAVTAANGDVLLPYERSVSGRHEDNVIMEMAGGAVALLGGLAALIGFFLARRKYARLVADYEAEQQRLLNEAGQSGAYPQG